MKKSKLRDPAFEKFLAEISPEILATLTNEQIEAIYKGCGYTNKANHSLNYRVSIPIPGIKLHLLFLAGTEKRSQARLRYEKGLYPVATPVNILFLIGFLSVISFCLYTILSFIFTSTKIPSLSSEPTSVSLNEDKYKCENMGKTGENNKCLDSEEIQSLPSKPTSIPWIHDQYRCENSGRTWENNNCWDSEHSPNF
jgi:hypothetical protein